MAHGMVRVEIEIAVCVGWLYVDRLRLARNIKKTSQCQTIIFSFCNPCACCTVFGNLKDVFVGAPCANMDFLLSKSQSQKQSCKIKKKLSELAMTVINVRTAFNGDHFWNHVVCLLPIFTHNSRPAPPHHCCEQPYKSSIISALYF